MKFLLLLLSLSVMAIEYKKRENTVQFSGHISRINAIASLLRVRIRFENAKYLRKGDKVEFWNETYPRSRCLAIIEGRSAKYLLMSVPKYKECVAKVHLTTGSYLHFHSDDLKKNLEVGSELVEILLKKRMAVATKLRRNKRDLEAYIEKSDSINKRYETLRQKLQLEWERELHLLEEDKMKTYKSYRDAQSELSDVEFKLQRYKIRDQNLIEQRWSLDPKLYFKK